MDVFHKIALGLLIAFPAMLVAVYHGGTFVLLFLFSMSLIALFLKRGDVSVSFEQHESLFIRSILFYVSIFVFHVLYFNSKLSILDNPIQILLLIPVYLYIRELNLSIKWFYLSILLGALACFLIAIYQYYFLMVDRPYGAIKVISFGSIGMVFSMMCLVIALQSKIKLLRVFFYLGMLLAFYASILTGARGAWIILLTSILILFVFNPSKWSLKLRFLGIGVMLIFIISSYFYPPIQQRMDLATEEFSAYMDKGKADNSVGVRLELWKAALIASSDNPILGIGEGNLQKKMTELVEENKIDSYVLTIAHVHQEYLSALLNRGLIGLLSVLLIFILPFIYFAKKVTSLNQEQNTLSTIGLILTSSAMTISLTDVYFLQHANTLFYFTLMFILFAVMKQNDIKRKASS